MTGEKMNKANLRLQNVTLLMSFFALHKDNIWSLNR